MTPAGMLATVAVLLACVRGGQALTVTTGGVTTHIRSLKRSINFGAQQFNVTGRAVARGNLCEPGVVNVTGRVAVLEHFSCHSVELLMARLHEEGALAAVLWNSDDLLDMGERVTQFWRVVRVPDDMAAVEIAAADSERLLAAMEADDDLLINLTSEENDNPWIELLLGPAYTVLLRVAMPVAWLAIGTIASSHLTLRIRRYGFRPRTRVPQMLTLLSTATALGNSLLLLLGAEGQGFVVSLQGALILSAVADTCLMTGVALMATVWRVSLSSKHAHAAGGIVKRHTRRMAAVMFLLFAISAINAAGRQGVILLRLPGFLAQLLLSGGFSLYFILSARRLLRQLAVVASLRQAAPAATATSRTSSVVSSTGGPSRAGRRSTVASKASTGEKAIIARSQNHRDKLSTMAYWLRIASAALLLRVLTQLLLAVVPHRPTPWLVLRLLGCLADGIVALATVLSVKRSGDPLVPPPCGATAVAAAYAFTTVASATRVERSAAPT
eukprot:PLAT10583.1.p1 GENE.PLAT10583.1~~PLAT10583.1.p1  ORF type:complete len:499 (+),score=134.29 PLAT10583.1:75-1571(+)